MASDLLTLLEPAGSAPPSRDRMLLAVLLRYLLETVEEKEGKDTTSPQTEPFREPAIRTRPDFFPSGG